MNTNLKAFPKKSSEDWLNLQREVLREIARTNPNSLLDWSSGHRFFQGKPMRLTPALQDLYRDDHHFVVVQKGAQVSISEYLINGALWAADTGQGGRGVALYVMPTQTQVDDFSQARVDKAIGESPYLQSRLLPPPPGKAGPARQGLKKIGPGYVYFRGSDNRKQLISIDADLVLLDEYDLMADGVLEKAIKRLGSSRLGLLRVASTPRYPEAGINGLFIQSDQRYFFLKCPVCGHAQRLQWEHNVDEKLGLVVCKRESCRKPMDLWAPGRWEAEAPSNDEIHGYHLNRLYSPLANIPQMVRESQARTPRAQAEFQNGVLGETFVPPGGQLTLDVLDRCRREYEMPVGSEEATFMGVDPGGILHVVIRRALEATTTRALFIGTVDTFEELDGLMERYRVRLCVIDALPETHKTVEFAKRHPRVWRAYYSSTEGHRWHRGRPGEKVVHLNRTQALEETFDLFTKGQLELPGDARQLGGGIRDGFGDYYRQMMALKRHRDENAHGNLVYRFDDHGKDDHYAHAELYCMIAKHTALQYSGRIEVAFLVRPR